MKFSTQAVHAGTEPDPTSGAIMTPIYQTSTYVQEEPGKHKGYEYARTGNPTRDALQNAMATLEGGKHGLCFASGMAAIDAIVKLLKPGDAVLSTNDLYGGTYRIFTKIFQNYGIQFEFTDLSKIKTTNEVETLIKPNTKMIWLETPTNPLLKIIDIQLFAQVAQKKGILTVVDNTFASPYLQVPLKRGADIVVHSTTKYIGGHSDVVGGCIVTNNDDCYTQLKFIQNACGATPGPMDCFLTLRGLKTLAVRMQRHCENAHKVAHFLREHTKVDTVLYPGFKEHTNHEVAAQQMCNFGGMVSFFTKSDTIADAIQIMRKTELFSLAESLGGVESLIGHPATMTHASIPENERIAAGLRNSLIRLSVGIEDADDLIADLKQALDSI